MNVPISARNSPTNPENPGSPIDANATARKIPPKTGAAFQSPPKSEMLNVCLLS